MAVLIECSHPAYWLTQTNDSRRLPSLPNYKLQHVEQVELKIFYLQNALREKIFANICTPN